MDGVKMDDVDEKEDLPIHLILGQRIRENKDQDESKSWESWRTCRGTHTLWMDDHIAWRRSRLN